MPRLFTLTIHLHNPLSALSNRAMKKKTTIKPEFWSPKVHANTPQAVFIRTLLNYTLSVDADQFNFNISQKTPPSLKQVVDQCDELQNMQEMVRCCQLATEWIGRTKKSKEWLNDQEKKIVCARISTTENYILQNMDMSELTDSLPPPRQFDASISTHQSWHEPSTEGQNVHSDFFHNSTENEEQQVEEEQERVDYYHEECFSSYLPEFETSPNATPNHQINEPESPYRSMVVTHEDTTPLAMSRTLSSDSVSWLGGFDQLNVNGNVGEWVPPEPIPYFHSIQSDL